jgi:CHAT domain-containing protein/tetratricopeptide (TPR) repeat protein
MDHPNTAAVLLDLARVYQAQGQQRAVATSKQALAIAERHGSNDRVAAQTMLVTASILLHWNEFAESERLLKRALAIREAALGANHPELVETRMELGMFYLARDNYVMAERLLSAAHDSVETERGVYGDTNSDVLNGLGLVHLAKGDYRRAVDYLDRGFKVMAENSRRTVRVGGMPFVEVVPGTDRQASYLPFLVRASYERSLREPTLAARLRDTAFRAVQAAQNSQAASALFKMAARSAKEDSELAKRVRERQDFAIEWQIASKALIAELSKPADTRDAKAENDIRKRLLEFEQRINEIDNLLDGKFPGYTAMVFPAPLGFSEVQSQLRSDEILIIIQDMPAWKRLNEESFLWAVPKSGEARWIRIARGTRGLMDDVATLRCGLDADAWDGARCRDLTNVVYTSADRRAGKPLPFDLTRAHDLYRTLFGQIEEMIKDKHLLVVSSGALATLPLQTLVISQPADTKGYADAAWLGTRQRITILPSVASLQALRRLSKPVRADRTYLGLGNPLLDGNPKIQWHQARARQARNRQRCPTEAEPWLQPSKDARGILPPLGQKGLADVSAVKALPPLPESTDELCAVARSLGIGQSEIWLGAKATERDLKKISADGGLAKFRVVHFATHGIVSGQMQGLAEPGLILTPPVTATETDDGYLSASEVSQLKLDAEWVILSVCNSAAGADTQAEALSGLARAFFYAGTRALLVSHWSVDSATTVALVTKALQEMRDTKVGRAEAMRRSMLTLIRSGEPAAAHPSNWAPFVVVGEGAR